MNKSLFTFTLFFVLLSTPIILNGQAKKLVRKGKKLADTEQQIAYFTEAIEIDNKNLDAYFYRGIARANLEDHWGAILDFSTVIFNKPDADSYFNRGNSKYALEDYKNAYEDYSKAVALDRSFFQAHYNLGMTQLHLKKFNKALHSFLFLLEHHPDDVHLHTQIGETLLVLDFDKLAIMYFNKCITLKNSSDAYYNRGMAYLDLKDFNKAIRDFNKAISIDKKNDAAHFYLGVSLLYKRNFEKAAKRFEHTLSYNSLDHEALVGLAIANYHNNNFNKARSYFKKAKNILTSYDTAYNTNDISLFDNTTWNLNEGIVFEAYYNKLNNL